MSVDSAVERDRGQDYGERETAVRVVAKRPVADGVLAIDMVSCDGESLPVWEPGAHVDVVIDGVAERQYSLSGDPGDRFCYRLGVLREERGRGTSRHIHDVLETGDEFRVRGPRNNFELRPSPHYLFIAGGIGITPILPMLQAAEKSGADWKLLYGGRQRASMAFLDELTRYGERVSITPQDETGLLDLDAVLGKPAADTLVYCCGPEPLLSAVEKHCVRWPSGSLRLERFASRTIDTAADAAFEVVLHRSGRTLTVPTDRSVLQVLRSAGVPVSSSCEDGVCGTCEIAVLDGEIEHRDSVLEDDEQAANDCMMVCISRARTPRLVLDL